MRRFLRLSETEKMRLKFLPRCMECRRGLAMRILSVCLSVRLSVKRVLCDKMEIYPSFLRRRMVGGGATPYLKFWVNRFQLERNCRFSTDIRS